MTMQIAGNHFADVPNNGNFSGLAMFSSVRYSELSRKQAYFACSQHDSKMYDFDGRIISQRGGVQATQPLMSGEQVKYYVPLRMRRPSSPYRLARVIVNSFTTLLFGEQRFPQCRVEGDPDSQDFLQTIARVAKLPLRMIQARNLGGACGTVGLSWAFIDGKPRVKTHDAKQLFVHQWADRDELRPKYVSEVFLYPKDEWDSQRRKFVRNFYWSRQDWTPNADVVFLPVKYEQGKDPAEGWRLLGPDFKKSTEHNDDLTHFHWVQNLPSDEIDGEPDYEGLYENFDTLDLISSILARGAVLNLDPTLKLKMDQMKVQMMGVKKGSDNALIVGVDGDAEYLELAGTSIEAGINLFNTKRDGILEVAQCVIPDPDEAAADTSAAAMRMRYATMTAKCDVLREQYGTAIQRLLEDIGDVARASMAKPAISYDQETGEPQEVQRTLDLPQKITKTPKEDADGIPTGEHDIEREDRTPGEGGEVELQWGPYFAPTPADQQATITALSTAVAAAPIMSTQTATELVMSAFGRPADAEVARVAKEAADADAKQQEMFAQQGAQLNAQGMPPGAKPKGGPPGAPKPPGGPPKLPGAGKPPGLPKPGGGPPKPGKPPGA